MRPLIIGVMSCFVLAACETVQGAGRDVQKAGQTIESAAN